MTSSRMLAAALAAVLAGPALAQGAADAARRSTGSPPATQQPQAAPPQAPAPADAAARAGQQAQPQGEYQQLLQALSTVLAHNDLSVRVGDLAATRATTPELQNLGRQLAEDHRRIGQELQGLLSARGTPVPEPTGREQLESEFMQLAAKTGPEFDREVTEFLTRNGPQFVDSLKRARDLTQGKDAQLKKFLDDAENVEEEHLTASRQVKAKRQARTPPR